MKPQNPSSPMDAATNPMISRISGVLSDPSRRDGPVGFIDGIQILIVPVVQGLRVSHQHRAGQDDTGQKFGIIFPRSLARLTVGEHW